MTRVTCPSCGTPGRGVAEITIRSLVRDEVRAELGAPGRFSFCASAECEVAYFAADGRTVTKSDVNVRIGVKETQSPRPLCYCFDHTAEQIEAEARAGSTAIVDEITAKCREGLDRCPETNPRGACCLGDVRRVAKSALSIDDEPARACCASAEPDTSSAGALPSTDASVLVEANGTESQAPGGWAFGASMATAVGAAFAGAACCVGPLVVALLGVGGAGAMVALTPYRPYLLGLTVGLLALGFYWVYRRRPVDDCGCETPEARRKRRVAAGTLWVTTALVALFAASPYLINAADASTVDGGSEAVATASTRTVVIPVQGMDCPSCAVPIRQALDTVGGVRAFDMDLDAHTITVTFEGESDTSRRYATAVSDLGYGVGEPREVR